VIGYLKIIICNAASLSTDQEHEINCLQQFVAGSYTALIYAPTEDPSVLTLCCSWQLRWHCWDYMQVWVGLIKIRPTQRSDFNHEVKENFFKWYQMLSIIMFILTIYI